MLTFVSVEMSSLLDMDVLVVSDSFVLPSLN
jgi:hypothetical protein